MELPAGCRQSTLTTLPVLSHGGDEARAGSKDHQVEGRELGAQRKSRRSTVPRPDRLKAGLRTILRARSATAKQRGAQRPDQTEERSDEFACRTLARPRHVRQTNYGWLHEER